MDLLRVGSQPRPFGLTNERSKLESNVGINVNPWIRNRSRVNRLRFSRKSKPANYQVSESKANANFKDSHWAIGLEVHTISIPPFTSMILPVI